MKIAITFNLANKSNFYFLIQNRFFCLVIALVLSPSVFRIPSSDILDTAYNFWYWFPRGWGIIRVQKRESPNIEKCCKIAETVESIFKIFILFLRNLSLKYLKVLFNQNLVSSIHLWLNDEEVRRESAKEVHCGVENYLETINYLYLLFENSDIKSGPPSY